MEQGKEHIHEDSCCGHQHATAASQQTKEVNKLMQYAPVTGSMLLLLTGLFFDFYLHPAFFHNWVRLAWYGLAYIPVGIPVARQGIRLMAKGDVFTEFTLMTVATVGAFAIGEYPEGVAVMIFYTVGELFQDAAVKRARRDIKALLDIRPDQVLVKVNGHTESRPAEAIKPGDIIVLRPGDRVAIDGPLLSPHAVFNTAALTGESKPAEKKQGEEVLAGMINQNTLAEVQASKEYSDSTLARMLLLIQDATTRKAKTELFIRKFARIYTPAVFFLALSIVVIPAFVAASYSFNDWLYRALVFLVISCPCALVISIPLGYFGGIGAASQRGILFKGASYLDLLARTKAVVMDKTGTLTEGIFKVQYVKDFSGNEQQWLQRAAALEASSTHPVARALIDYVGKASPLPAASQVTEIAGAGLKGMVAQDEVLAGNLRLMQQENIEVPAEVEGHADTLLLVAVNNKFAGYLALGDSLKLDAQATINEFKKMNIAPVMLSGDKQSVVDKVAGQLGMQQAYGGLMPADKVTQMEAVKSNTSGVTVFVGDGINDAPVLAQSDVGMAMGKLGSDLAIETADVIIQTDEPSRIPTAIRIARATRSVVWQNIILAFSVKAMVLLIAAGGIATMWEAVFADVGVALLAVLNATRIQNMKI